MALSSKTLSHSMHDFLQHFKTLFQQHSQTTLHLLIKYDDFKEAMIANAKAGGDSSSRGMIVAMLMGAQGCSIPPSWRKTTKGV